MHGTVVGAALYGADGGHVRLAVPTLPQRQRSEPRAPWRDRERAAHTHTCVHCGTECMRFFSATVRSRTPHAAGQAGAPQGENRHDRITISVHFTWTEALSSGVYGAGWCVWARAPVRSGNSNWLPDSAGCRASASTTTRRSRVTRWASRGRVPAWCPRASTLCACAAGPTHVAANAASSSG